MSTGTRTAGSTMDVREALQVSPSDFRLRPYGWLILLRSLPGLVSIVLSGLESVVWAGALLLGSVGADLLVSWHAKRRGWEKHESELEIEGFVDFTCFVWAPLQFGFVLFSPVALVIPAVVFALAGMFRLARFNVEGVVAGGYRGLPVTYNGVLFPIAGLLSHYVDGMAAVAGFDAMLLTLAALMASGRFVTPEVSP